MHPASTTSRSLTTLTLVVALALISSGSALAGDRTPLLGSETATLQRGGSVVNGLGAILSVDPNLLPCPQLVNFDDLEGGPTPGTNYDGVIASAGLFFGERFAGQITGASGDFDAISGAPTNPLTAVAGAAGQNLDLFDYAGNVLTGLGPIGYPDIDAIGEGAISIRFPMPQSQVKLDLVGGNGGSATLEFYRADGSLIDVVVVSGLADLTYGFAMFDASASIAGILVQNTDASGMGVVNICYDPGPVPVRVASWGSIKQIYR